MVKSVYSRYLINVYKLSRAYYFQLSKLEYLILRSLSHPNNVIPIPCIKMVVDCILVEPASAISPTLQFILCIFSLYMNYFDLWTFSLSI